MDVSDALCTIESAIIRWKKVLRESEGEVEKARNTGNGVAAAYARMYRVQRIIVNLENAYAESSIIKGAEVLSSQAQA
jgi:hypothetical protein